MQIYNLKTVKTDTTFEGVQFILPTGESYNLTNAVVTLDVCTSGAVVKSYTNTLGLLVTLPYTIALPQHLVAIPAGVYDWYLKITFADGRKKKWIGGKWEIEK